MIKIAVDAMGGDGSPKKVIDGIVFNHQSNVNVFYKIFGDQKKISQLIDGKINKKFYEILQKACRIWNSLIGDMLEKSQPLENGKYKGTIIQGSAENSDFCASISFIKNKLKTRLLNDQSSGDPVEWAP